MSSKTRSFPRAADRSFPFILHRPFVEQEPIFSLLYQNNSYFGKFNLTEGSGIQCWLISYIIQSYFSYLILCSFCDKYPQNSLLQALCCGLQGDGSTKTRSSSPQVEVDISGFQEDLFLLGTPVLSVPTIVFSLCLITDKRNLDGLPHY